MSGAAGMGLYGNSGRGSAPGNQVEELSVEEKGKYDFHHFLRRFAVHREEIHTDAQSFDYIPYIFGLDHYGNIPLIEYLEYQKSPGLRSLSSRSILPAPAQQTPSVDLWKKLMESSATRRIFPQNEPLYHPM